MCLYFSHHHLFIFKLWLPPPPKKNIYTLFFCTSLMYRLLLCAHRTHCCLYLHEARGISRALMLDWLKSAELNTPPSLQNPSSLKRHVDYTYKSVHFFYNLLLFIYFLEQVAFKIIVSKVLQRAKPSNRSVWTIGGSASVHLLVSFLFAPQQVQRIIKDTLVAWFLFIFYFFRVSPCVLWISVGKVGHYVTDPSLINYCCWHQHCWKAT